MTLGQQLSEGGVNGFVFFKNLKMLRYYSNLEMKKDYKIGYR